MAFVKTYALTFLLLALSLQRLPAQAKIDSLKQVVAAGAKDTNTVKALNDLCWEYKNIARYREALDAGTQAIGLAGQLGYKRGLAKAYKVSGTVNIHLGNYPEALKHFLSALQQYTDLGNKYSVAGCHISIGIIYWFQKNYPAAKENYEKALPLYRELNNKKGIADTYGNIGLLFFEEGKMALAKKDFSNAEAKLAEALEYYRKVLAAYLELSAGSPAARPHLESIAGSYNNISNVYTSLAEMERSAGRTAKVRAYLDSVEQNCMKGLQIFEKLGEKHGVAGTYNNLANVNYEFGNNARAISFALPALELSLATGSKDDIKSAYFNLYRAHESGDDFKKAYEYYKLYTLYRDSLVNEANTKKTVQAEMQFEFDKKEAAAKLEQEKKEAVAEAERRRQRIVLLSISGFGLLVLGFAIFAYRSFLQKKKANVEISRQKQLIEEKQKEILDSIHYARRIQRSLITQEAYIQKHLKRLQGQQRAARP
jgi:hypothetical protein